MVEGGPLHNRRFRDLSPSTLRRVAKRYPQDHKLQKFAKVFVAMETLAEAAPAGAVLERPAPCQIVPRNPSPAEQPVGNRRLLVWFRRCMGSLSFPRSLPRGILLGLCILVLCRPSSMRLTAKFLGFVARLCARRALELVTLLLDQVIEEFMYSVDSAILPENLQGACPRSDGLNPLVQAANIMVSAVSGALIALFARWLGQPPAVVPAAP